MKGGVGGGIGISSYGPSTKRRWRGSVIAVLGLVILSMLVPLVFLLGLHTGFHSTGSTPEQPSPVSRNVGGYSLPDSRNMTTQPKKDHSRHVDELIKRFGPQIQKGIRVAANKTDGGHQGQDHQSKGPIGRQNVAKGTPESSQKVKVNGPVDKAEQVKVVDENDVSCELRYGSYCLWRCKYREDMKDTLVKKIKDLLFVARAYYPSIAKLSAHEKLSRELRQNIQDFEHVLSVSSSDADLPQQIEKKLPKMEAAISKSKSVHGVDCGNVDKKFRQLLDLTEDEANFHTRQSAFLYKLAVQTMPKSHHCLSMRLTVEYFRSPLLAKEDASLAQRYMDSTLYHYVIFSNNILASSVVINSTVANAKDSRRLAFHVLTDRQNYFSMRLWFTKHTYKEAAVNILNVEDQELMLETEPVPLLSMPEEFRISLRSAKMPKMQHAMEYMSLFSFSHYTLPKIFQGLDKVVILDDDVVVQQDLSALWNIDLEGKVNGAIQHCAVTLGQLNNYLGKSSFNKKSCAWMSGLNVVDLAKWRELDLTGKFRRLVQELNAEGTAFGAVASRASLLTFRDLVYALDGKYVMSGLGHDYGLDLQAIRKAAVLHYNGNMKPWLELRIPRYKGFWAKYIDREDQFLSECNVSA